jgi:hypothetical protein
MKICHPASLVMIFRVSLLIACLVSSSVTTAEQATSLDGYPILRGATNSNSAIMEENYVIDPLQGVHVNEANKVSES